MRFFLVSAKLDDHNGPFVVFPVAYLSTLIINFVYCTMSMWILGVN